MKAAGERLVSFGVRCFVAAGARLTRITVHYIVNVRKLQETTFI